MLSTQMYYLLIFKSVAKCDTKAYEYTLAEFNYICVNFSNFAVSCNEMQGNSNMQIKIEL
jgi:hypothetical protein